MIDRESTVRRRLNPRRLPSDDGYVAVFVALCLPLLIGMCALAIDVATWQFRGAQIQKAADSAALAGVVYLPSSPDNADAAAKNIARLNGFENGVDGVTITTAPVPGKPSRLRVTITAPVDNAFGMIFGQETSLVTRTVVADFAGPVPMGSPCSNFGNLVRIPGGPAVSPSTGCEASPDLWMQIAGPQAEKLQGDRYAANRCGNATTVFVCDSNTGPNDEFTRNGYFYVIRVKQAGMVTLQAFDPGFVNTGGRCEDTLNGNWNANVTGINPVTSSNANARRLYASYADPISTMGSDSAGKAANTAGPYCTGDSWAGNSPQTVTNTSFILRGPYDQGDPSATPVLTGCNGSGIAAANAGGPGWSQFAGYDVDNLRQALTQGQPGYGDGKLARMFRQWVPLCTFNAGVGDYLVQVRTNVAIGTDPTVAGNGNTAGGGGQNKLALRVTGANAGTTSVFGLGRMSIYANAATETRQFFLARASSATAGKVLLLQLYDIGDVTGCSGTCTGSLTILPPTDSNIPGGRFANCTATVTARVGGNWVDQNDPASRSNCSTTSTTGTSSGSATNYNGKVLTFRVPIPKTYTCNDGSAQGCWIKIQYGFSISPTDVTTWSASIEGDPVRIVE